MDGNKCESPIEKIFYISAFDKISSLEPQYQIDKVRVDFAIPELKIAIKCDGEEKQPLGNEVAREVNVS